jgi:hypothetical protein
MSFNKIDSLQLMSGTPLVFDGLDICILQPSLKDIAFLGESFFYTGLSYFLISKERLSLDADISDFDLFMYVINQNQEIQQRISDIFILTIQDIDKISFYDNFIIIKTAGHECIIDEPKFLIIKETYKQIFCLDSSTSSVSSDYNPANEAARKIAEKLNKRKYLLSNKEEKKDASIFTNLISILAIGSNSLNISECLNLTVFQIYNLIKRFNLHTQYHMQIQALMQGAKDVDLVDWTKQI